METPHVGHLNTISSPDVSILDVTYSDSSMSTHSQLERPHKAIVQHVLGHRRECGVRADWKAKCLPFPIKEVSNALCPALSSLAAMLWPMHQFM